MDPSSWDFNGDDDDDEDDKDDKDDDYNDLDELSNDWKWPVSRTHGLATPRKERRTFTHSSPSKVHFPPAPPKFHPTTGLTTPVRGVGRRFTMTERDEDSDDIFTTPPVNRARSSIFTRPKTPPAQNSIPTRPTTPPPQHQLQHAVPTTPKSNPRFLGSPGRGLRDDMITDVFALLIKGGVNLKESAKELRELLRRQVLQKEGLSQGREVARQALARKNKECTQLKAQVRELEELSTRAEMAQETLRGQMFELTHELGMPFDFWWKGGKS